MFKDESSGNYELYKKMMSCDANWQKREEAITERTGIEYGHGIKVKGLDKKGYKDTPRFIGVPVGSSMMFSSAINLMNRTHYFFDTLTPVSGFPFVLPGGDLFYEFMIENIVNIDPTSLAFGFTLNTTPFGVINGSTNSFIATNAVFIQPNIFYDNSTGNFIARSHTAPFSEAIVKLTPGIMSVGRKICVKIDSKYNVFLGTEYDTLTNLMNVKNILEEIGTIDSCNLRTIIKYLPNSNLAPTLQIKNIASGYTPPLVMDNMVRTLAAGPIDLSEAAGFRAYLIDYTDLFDLNSPYDFPTDYNFTYKRDGTNNIQMLFGFLKPGFTITTFNSLAAGVKPAGVARASLLTTDYLLCIDSSGNIYDDGNTIILSPPIPNTLNSEFYIGLSVIDSTRCRLQLGDSKTNWRYEKITLISNIYGIGATTNGTVVLTQIRNK